MAIDQESFNTELYRLLKTRGYKPVPKDLKNKRSQPEDADVFSFTFIKDGKEYGEAWVTIDGAQNLVLYYSNEQDQSPGGKSPNVSYDDSWYGLKKHLKQWAMARQLSFDLKNKDELGDDMDRRNYVTKKERVSEAYHPMGKKASYNDVIPQVKIILQHSRQIEEGEQRYRNVAKIFLENQDGERFLAPTNRPGIAQVYARHIAEGGVPNDERWNHIKSICEEYSQMAGFVRATRNKQFNESAQSLVSEGINHYQSLRETLGKLRGHRGYNTYFESWTPALMEDDVDDNKINELFVQETVDPRIESVMPILSRLYKKTEEVSVNEVKELEEWAEGIVEDMDGPIDGKKLNRAITKSKKTSDRLVRKARQWMKRTGKSAEEAAKEFDLRQDEIDQLDEAKSDTLRRKFNKAVLWDGHSDPKDMIERVRNMSDKELVALADMGMDDHYPNTDGSPRQFQIKIINQELKRRFGVTPKGNIKTEETLEGLDKNQKKAGQLGPTEKVGPNGAVGKLVGEAVEHDSPEEDVIMDIVNGNIDVYQVVNKPETEAQEKVSGIIQQMYDRISSEHGLHPDDDFEKIYEIIMSELTSEYDPYGQVDEDSVLEDIKRLIK